MSSVVVFNQLTPVYIIKGTNNIIQLNAEGVLNRHNHSKGAAHPSSAGP